MKCVYRHMGVGNYLLIKGNGTIPESDYRIKMLEKNQIKRFLNMKVNYIDNAPWYHYEISSKQSLKEYFSGRRLVYEDMKRIVEGMREAMLELEKYLLLPENMVLDPEHLYIDPLTKEPFFCYFPEEEILVIEAIRELFRFFLNSIDNEDKKTVQYAYDIYCKSMHKNFTLKELEGEEMPPTDEKLLAAAEEEICDAKETVPVTWREKIYQFLQGFCRESKIQKKSENERNDTLLELEKQNWEEEENTGETTLMEFYTEADRLISLNEAEVIELSESPYILGKKPGEVNRILDSPMVSRIHARILKEEEGVYVQDMNSTNGTFVNGMRIPPYEKRKLYTGDSIRFADQEYRYQQFH